MSLPFFRSATSRGYRGASQANIDGATRVLVNASATFGAIGPTESRTEMMTGRRSMKRTPRTIGAALLGLWAATQTASADAVQWPCPVKPVESCFRHHGRLSSQNGIALTIWLVGTTRRVGLANDLADLPAFIRKYLVITSPDHSYVFGDFEMCPTEPDTPGHLREVCVASAERLVVQNLQRSTPPFRLLPTWPRSVVVDREK